MLAARWSRIARAVAIVAALLSGAAAYGVYETGHRDAGTQTMMGGLAPGHILWPLLRTLRSTLQNSSAGPESAEGHAPRGL